MVVKLRRCERRYRDLTPERPYVVIGIEADDLRILNDEGRPFLYPSRIFRIIDRRETDDRINESHRSTALVSSRTSLTRRSGPCVRSGES